MTDGRGSVPRPAFLAASTRASTTHTPVTAPVPRHDGAADVATGGVAEIHQFAESVGGVVETSIFDRAFST